eukprot:546030_1
MASVSETIEGVQDDTPELSTDVLSGVEVQDWIMLVFEGSLFLAPLILGPLFVMLYRLYLYGRENGYKYEDHVIKAVTSFIERPFYNYLYNTRYNGEPSASVYELNFKYKNVYDCRVCLHEFGATTAQKEDILHCGHRFHRKCLRAWELQQLHVMQLQHYYFKAYQCPMCRTEYNWKQKWDDAIGHYVRMHHRYAMIKDNIKKKDDEDEEKEEIPDTEVSE